VQQPVISGGLSLVVLHALLCAQPARAKAETTETKVLSATFAVTLP
jgi:hypothetical protein